MTTGDTRPGEERPDDFRRVLTDVLFRYGYDVPADRGQRIAQSVMDELAARPVASPGDDLGALRADEWSKVRDLAERGICPVCDALYRTDGHSFDCPLSVSRRAALEARPASDAGERLGALRVDVESIRSTAHELMTTGGALGSAAFFEGQVYALDEVLHRLAALEARPASDAGERTEVANGGHESVGGATWTSTAANASPATATSRPGPGAASTSARSADEADTAARSARPTDLAALDAAGASEEEGS